MREIIFEIQEDDVDGGFVAHARGFGIHTQAESIPELKVMIADAVRCHFDGEAETPQVIRSVLATRRHKS